MKPIEDKQTKIECSKDGSKYIFSPGDEFYYEFSRHGSVGINTDFVIEDEHIISHEKTETRYLHPERLKPGWTGGDQERGRWTFRALKPGATKLTIRDIFRFEIEDECTIEIEVR